ncbi:MAG TPA: lipid II flippase MurJ, partial [Candidatus Polarisedimenticolia bacterium]|nr:lipid II flippase MurJ [Candidatus Polarisedimenticolia bacterium]
MPADSKAAAPTTIDHKAHSAFFRQSGWMMIATISAGFFSFGMHFLNKKIPDAEYGLFVTLLMVTACIPATPLQLVFAQQSAQALATNRERQLSGMIRLVWLWTFLVWLAAVVVVVIYHAAIVKRWQMADASGLWVTLPVLLMSLWMPLFFGVLQGRQDFFWYGWSTMLGGLGRLVGGALIVFLLFPSAAGLMGGALIGIGVAAGVGIWRTRDLWSLPPEPFDVKATLGQVVPLMLGFGAYQFMFTSDTMFAKAFFSADAMKSYGEAGTLSRALLWLVTPLATVMFPKLVHSHAKAEKSNLLNLVLLGTGVLGICGLIGLWVVGPLVVKIVYKSTDVNATVSLIPWYAGAMIPLGLANVMVNDLMARKQFKVVPLMILIAIAYAFTLPYMLHRHPGE